jgi:hypothetical protein
MVSAVGGESRLTLIVVRLPSHSCRTLVEGLRALRRAMNARDDIVEHVEPALRAKAEARSRRWYVGLEG